MPLHLGEHARGLGGKRAKQRELLGGQLDLPIAEHHLARDGVDPQLAHLQDTLRPPLPRTPEDGADSCGQLGVVEGLTNRIGFWARVRADPRTVRSSISRSGCSGFERQPLCGPTDRSRVEFGRSLTPADSGSFADPSTSACAGSNRFSGAFRGARRPRLL
jgi:hypothetical protein